MGYESAVPDVVQAVFALTVLAAFVVLGIRDRRSARAHRRRLAEIQARADDRQARRRDLRRRIDRLKVEIAESNRGLDR